MENIMLIKENGKVAEAKRITLTSPSVYLSDEESCFFGAINQEEIKNIKKEQIYILRNNIYSIVEEVSSIKQEDIVINNLMEKLKYAKSMQDLIRIAKLLIKQYEISKELKFRQKHKFVNNVPTNVITKNIRTQLEVNPDIVVSIMVKKIIIAYFYDKLMKFSNEELSQIEYEKITIGDMDQIFKKLDVKFTRTQKNNGVYYLSKKILNDTIDMVYDVRQQHLCFDCKNAHPNQCPKLTDEIHKRIENYSFVETGYQILNENGKVDRFMVTKCSNFEQDIPRKLTSSEFVKLKEIKSALCMTYFDAENIEEAKAKQRFLTNYK